MSLPSPVSDTCPSHFSIHLTIRMLFLRSTSPETRRHTVFFSLLLVPVYYAQISFSVVFSRTLSASSCLHCTSIVSKHFLLFQPMHTIIRITEMLKKCKIIIIAPTCFGSRWNHRQGAVLCLAKTTNMVFLCTSV